MALAALGLATQLTAIRSAGIKPLLASILFAWLVVGGALVNAGCRRCGEQVGSCRCYSDN